MSKAVSIVLLVLFVCAAVVAGFLGLLLSMFSDPCGSSAGCDYNLIGWGVAIASLGQVPLVVAILWWTVHRLRRDRAAWWVPVIGVVGVVGLLFLGAYVASAGVTPDGSVGPEILRLP